MVVISREELIEEVQRLMRELGRTPRKVDMEEHGEYSYSTYLNRIGGWNDVLEEAGFEPNVEFVYGPYWSDTREEVLERDGGRCQSCGVEDESLHVHHITPVHVFENYEDANRLENLVVLCEGCHHELEGRHILSTAEEFKTLISS